MIIFGALVPHFAPLVVIVGVSVIEVFVIVLVRLRAGLVTFSTRGHRHFDVGSV